MRKKICFVVAVPGSAVAFLCDHINGLAKEYDIYLVANFANRNSLEILNIQGWQSIGIERGINIIKDIKALFQLRRYFKRMQFDVVHSVTPKAGLLTALAARMVRIPNRIHIFTGQVWATKKGFMRWLLMFTDKIIVRYDTRIMVDGKSQRQFLVDNRILKQGQGIVLGSGSICGVNTQRFTPDSEVRNKIRMNLKIRNDTVVYVFLGRLNIDKGIRELLTAYNDICSVEHNTLLLIVGPDETNMGQTISLYPNLALNDNIIMYGATPEPEVLLQAGDIFCLPTYREGFGSSVLEASCLGLPVICSDVYGVMDAMLDNVTGLRCKVKDSKSLFQCMLKLAQNKELRLLLGNNGRDRVLNEFSGEHMTCEWVNYYHSILS